MEGGNETPVQQRLPREETETEKIERSQAEVRRYVVRLVTPGMNVIISINESHSCFLEFGPRYNAAVNLDQKVCLNVLT